MATYVKVYYDYFPGSAEAQQSESERQQQFNNKFHFAVFLVFCRTQKQQYTMYDKLLIVQNIFKPCSKCMNDKFMLNFIVWLGQIASHTLASGCLH